MKNPAPLTDSNLPKRSSTMFCHSGKTKNIFEMIPAAQKFSIKIGVPSNQKLPKMRLDKLPTNGTRRPVKIKVTRKTPVRINTCTVFVF